VCKLWKAVAQDIILRKWRQKLKEDYEAKAIQGLSYRCQANWDLIDDCDLILLLDPTHTNTLHLKAKLLIYERQYHSALMILLYMEQIQTPTSPLLNNIGSTLQFLCQYERAMTYLNKALDLNPHNACALHNKGLIYIKRRQYNQAELWFREVVNIIPQDSPCWEKLLFSLCEQNKLEEAYQYAQTAIIVCPTNRIIRNYHENLSRQLGNTID
jgi:tetratricopeptide (TPR) repeat protein